MANEWGQTQLKKEMEVELPNRTLPKGVALEPARVSALQRRFLLIHLLVFKR